MKLSDEQVLRWAWESKLGTALTHSPETDQRLYIEGADWHDEISTALTLAYAAGARDMQERAVNICESVASFEISNASSAYQQGREMGATFCGVYIRALGDDDD